MLVTRPGRPFVPTMTEGVQDGRGNATMYGGTGSCCISNDRSVRWPADVLCSLQIKDPRHCALTGGQAHPEAEGLRLQG